MVTKNVSKQRKALYNSSLKDKRKQLKAPLDKRLKEELKKKSLSLRKGDTVKVMVGKFKGKTGKIERINYNKTQVFVNGLTFKDRRGQDKLFPFDASNLLITEADLEDVKRIKNKSGK